MPRSSRRRYTSRASASRSSNAARCSSGTAARTSAAVASERLSAPRRDRRRAPSAGDRGGARAARRSWGSGRSKPSSRRKCTASMYSPTSGTCVAKREPARRRGRHPSGAGRGRRRPSGGRRAPARSRGTPRSTRASSRRRPTGRLVGGCPVHAGRLEQEVAHRDHARACCGGGAGTPCRSRARCTRRCGPGAARRPAPRGRRRGLGGARSTPASAPRPSAGCPHARCGPRTPGRRRRCGGRSRHRSTPDPWVRRTGQVEGLRLVVREPVDARHRQTVEQHPVGARSTPRTRG